MSAAPPDSISLDRVLFALVEGTLSHRDFGQKIAETLGGRGCLARGLDVATMACHVVLHAGFRQEQIDEWMARWGAANSRLVAELDRFERGRAFDGIELRPDGGTRGNPCYPEWLSPAGFCRELVGVVERDDRALGLYSVYRAAEDPPFSREEIDGLERAIPYLRLARKIYMRDVRDEQEKTALFDCWDALGVGAILVEADGRVVRGNARGLELLASGTPFSSAGFGPTLHADRPEVAADILRRVSEVAATGSEPRAGLLRVDRPGSSAPLSLRILPFLPDGGAPYGRPAAIILFCEPVDEIVPGAVETLREAWRLTPTEARIAAELAAGRTIAEAAERGEITVSTARTHLKRIMEKSGTSRQAELVRRALALVPVTHVDEP